MNPTLQPEQETPFCEKVSPDGSRVMLSYLRLINTMLIDLSNDIV
jgi:hypothetical protein